VEYKFIRKVLFDLKIVVVRSLMKKIRDGIEPSLKI